MKYMHTMGFHLAIKKNKIRKPSGKWTDLVSMMLRKVTQTQKDKLHVLFHKQTLACHLCAK